MKDWNTNLDNMVYIIRDEGILPLTDLCNKFGEGVVISAQSNFIKHLYNIISNTFKTAKTIVINTQEQVEMTQKELKGTKTISLDTYYNGTYNISVTRLFEFIGGTDKFLGLVSRKPEIDLKHQISLIKPGEYILVDDDVVGGRTIREVIKMLPDNVKIVDTYLMMNKYRNKLNEPILDVVDCRDFIAGIQGCGLTTQITNIGIVRLPYMYPFVNIGDKANIPEGQEVLFSKQIWDLNKQFWLEINKDIKILDTGIDFKKILNHLGLSENDYMVDVCDRFKALAENGLVFCK